MIRSVSFGVAGAWLVCLTALGAAPESAPAVAQPTDELTLDAVVRAILERNPTLEQMQAAQNAVAARYPQVTALDDPMLGLTAAPPWIGGPEKSLQSAPLRSCKRPSRLK